MAVRTRRIRITSREYSLFGGVVVTSISGRIELSFGGIEERVVWSLRGVLSGDALDELVDVILASNLNRTEILRKLSPNRGYIEGMRLIIPA
jgi:hypothetical protein